MTDVNDAISMLNKTIDVGAIWPTPDERIMEKSRKDPFFFMREVLGLKKTWEGQDRIIRSVLENERTSVFSGHALGKDHISARLMLWFLYSFTPAIVVATSSSDRQISKVIWGELSEAYHGSKVDFRGRFMEKQIVVDNKSKWYAIGFSTKDVHKTPGKFQGFHQKNVMLLFSEAQAIEDSIWDQGDSLMTGEMVRWLAIGNPLVNYGAFAQTDRAGCGWNNLRLDCETSPNVISGKNDIPGLCSKAWVDGMAKKFGKDHPTYRAKVNGIKPPISVDTFINGKWLLTANNHPAFHSDAVTGTRALGVDIASTGGDKTVITIRHGIKVIKTIKAEKQSTMVTADKIAELLRGTGYYAPLKVDKAYLDVTGIGTGVYDRLIQHGLKRQVVPINNGAKPVDDPFDTSGLSNTQKYANLGTQMYDHVATLLENSKIAFEFDEDLNTQLSNRKMQTLKNGKKMLEPKDQFKARGFDSPDEADSLVLCFCEVQAPNDEPAPYSEVEEEDTGISEIFK